MCEDNFGAVRVVSADGRPIDPKPKYTAAVTLQRTLGNFQRYDGRVLPAEVSPGNISRRDVFVLRFRNDTSTIGTTTAAAAAAGVGFAVWTNGSFVQGKCSVDHTSRNR